MSPRQGLRKPYPEATGCRAFAQTPAGVLGRIPMGADARSAESPNKPEAEIKCSSRSIILQRIHRQLSERRAPRTPSPAASMFRHARSCRPRAASTWVFGRRPGCFERPAPFWVKTAHGPRCCPMPPYKPAAINNQSPYVSHHHEFRAGMLKKPPTKRWRSTGFLIILYLESKGVAGGIFSLSRDFWRCLRNVHRAGAPHQVVFRAALRLHQKQ